MKKAFKSFLAWLVDADFGARKALADDLRKGAWVLAGVALMVCPWLDAGVVAMLLTQLGVKTPVAVASSVASFWVTMVLATALRAAAFAIVVKK